MLDLSGASTGIQYALGAGCLLLLASTIWYGWAYKATKAELERARKDRDAFEVAAVKASADARDAAGRLQAIITTQRTTITAMEKTRDENETPEARLARLRLAGAGGSLLPGAPGPQDAGHGAAGKGVPEGGPTAPAAVPLGRPK